MRIWRCTRCESPGIRAPERMAQDDVRRFCLPCSVRTGKLVRREIPAVRVAKAEHAVKRKQHKVERKQRQSFAAMRKADAAMWFTCPVTGSRERVDVLVLACMHALTGKTKTPPTVNLRRSRTRYATTGRAWPGQNRIALTLGFDCDIAKLREIVLHECTHIAAGDGRDRNRTRADWHGPKFQRMMCDAAQALWGVTVEPLAHPGAYGPSEELVRVLRAKFVTVKGCERN